MRIFCALRAGVAFPCHCKKRFCYFYSNPLCQPLKLGDCETQLLAQMKGLLNVKLRGKSLAAKCTPNTLLATGEKEDMYFFGSTEEHVSLPALNKHIRFTFPYTLTYTTIHIGQMSHLRKLRPASSNVQHRSRPLK